VEDLLMLFEQMAQISSKYLLRRSRWQIPPAPAPTPKWRHHWVHWAVHSVVNLAIFLPNVSYVQTILLSRSVKGIRCSGYWSFGSAR
jgi:hypothetical protein